MTVSTFPTLIGQAYPSKYAPSWRTRIQEALSGHDYRLQQWTYPRYKFEIPVSYVGSNITASAGFSQNTDWQTLVGFYNSLGGAARPFHWNYPYDNAVLDTARQTIGVGDASNKDFYFSRTLGGFAEPVSDAITTGLKVYVNSVLKATPADFTYIAEAVFGFIVGVHFGTAPGIGLNVDWSGTYNWACRFDEDMLDFDNFMFHFWELKKVAFTSMKVAS